MVSDVLPLLLGSVALTGVGSAVVTAMFNRRRIRAETTSLITNAAGGIVQNLQDDNTRLRSEQAIAVLRERRRKKSEKARDERFRAELAVWNAHLRDMSAKLRAAGIEVSDPPPLEFPDYDTDEELVIE